MPVSPTYPGVYVQELPSGNRTIVGVSTSITAFVGRTRRGPTNDPTRVSSFGDFERKFGSLWAKSPLTYAVRQYFQAGGKEALIVRVVDTTEGTGTAEQAKARLGFDNYLHLRARNVDRDVNDYGNDYEVSIRHPEVGTENWVHRFTLEISGNGVTETYGVTMLEADADDDWMYVGDLPAAVGAGNLADVVTVPSMRPPVVTDMNMAGGTASGPAWLAIPGTILWLRATTTADPYGNDLTVSVELDATGADDAYVLTVSPATGSDEVHYLSTTSAGYFTGFSSAYVEVLGYALQRPNPGSGLPLSGGTGEDNPATIALDGIRGMRVRASATHLDGLGDDVTVTIAHTTTNRFNLTVSGDPFGSSPTVSYTIEVTVDKRTANSETGPYFIGELPDPASTDPLINALLEVVDFSGHVPDAVAGQDLDDSQDRSSPDLLAVGEFPTSEAYIELSASSPGAWGNTLRATVDHNVSSDADGSIFNLTVEEVDADGNVLNSEQFRNVSLNPEHERYLVRILDEQSGLVELTDGSEEFMRLATVSRAPFAGGSDGGAISVTNMMGNEGNQTGLYALNFADIFNLLVLPPPSPDTEIGIDDWPEALTYCEGRRAVLIADAPSAWDTSDSAETGITSAALTSEYGAMYFPWVRIPDPLKENRLRAYPPAAVVAGLIAKTDAQRGIWKAPAGLDARTPIVRELTVKLTDSENGVLNPLGLNCLRTFPSVGSVVWGARTLAGADRLASDWKYLPVRRLALYIEESLYRGLQWAVFEPNDEPLWGQIRLAAGGFMQQLFRQGAFKGATPKDAYFVRCDSDTTTDADIDRGIVNVIIGFAPLKPAEFVVISIQQIAGQVGA